MLQKRISSFSKKRFHIYIHIYPFVSSGIHSIYVIYFASEAKAFLVLFFLKGRIFLHKNLFSRLPISSSHSSFSKKTSNRTSEKLILVPKSTHLIPPDGFQPSVNNIFSVQEIFRMARFFSYFFFHFASSHPSIHIRKRK